MAKYTITIDTDDLTELAELANRLTGSADTPAATPKKKKKATAKKAEVTEAPQDSATTAVSEDVEPEADVPETLADLTALVGKFVQENGAAGGAKMVAALAKFNASKLSDVKPKDYGALVREYTHNA